MQVTRHLISLCNTSKYIYIYFVINNKNARYKNILNLLILPDWYLILSKV